MVIQTVDGEDLLAVDVTQRKGCLDVVKLIHEPALVKEHEDIGIANDGFLDNRGGGDILNLLCHHTDHCPVLSGCLIEVLDVLCHDRCCDGFPCFLDDKTLTAFFQAHLLSKDIHDDEHNDWKQYRIVLDLVNLENDELLIKK